MNTITQKKFNTRGETTAQCPATGRTLFIGARILCDKHSPDRKKEAAIWNRQGWQAATRAEIKAAKGVCFHCQQEAAK